MFLAEAKVLEAVDSAQASLSAAIAGWQECQPSAIADHRRRCCRIAQEWLFAMDYSQMNAHEPLAAPRWIRRRCAWGPTRWPIHWCEAVEAKTLDCGALAALARAAFIGRGVRCHATQLIQRYSIEDSKHWYRNWELDSAEVRWIKGELVYHEACSVALAGAQIKIWDPTASFWLSPKQFEGYGSVLALRIVTADPVEVFQWGDHKIPPNRWHQLPSA